MQMAAIEQAVGQVNAQLPNDSEVKWSLKVVSLDAIYMDLYQRPLKERWLAERDGALDVAMLGTLTLSDRPKGDRAYACMDGQHRIELMRRHGMTQWVAVTFSDLTREKEAELFARYQRERRATTPLQNFGADVIAKKAQSLDIKKIVEDCGFVIGEHEGAGSIKAVQALKMIHDDDRALLIQTLRLIRETWGDLPYAQNERTLKGVWQFLRENPDVDEARFVDRLGAVTPSVLVRNAALLRDARGAKGSMHRFIKEAIENQYRTRSRKGE